MKTKIPKRKIDSGDYFSAMSAFALVTQIGIMMMVAMAVGFAMGWGLDSWLGTSPWFIVIFSIIGVAAGFQNVYRLIKKKFE